MTQELFDSDVPRSEEMLRVCSWCNRVEQDGQWVEDAVRESRIFERSRPPMMTHGICEICVQRMIDTILTE